MDSVRLVQFTDTHLRADPAARLRGALVQPRLQACIEHARKRHFPVDAVAVTGDLVHDEPAAYGTLELMFDGMRAPVLLIPGNHDVPDELRRRLGHAPFQLGGTLSRGNWTIVMLESWSASATNGEGQLGVRQLQELDTTLAGQRSEHVLVFVHHPPIPVESAGMDALGLRDAQALLRSIESHPSVRGVAFGHAHQALDVFTRGGRRMMCTPATCMQFRPRQAGFEVDDRPPGYRVIDLHADGGIATEVVWLEGYAD